MIIPQEVFCVLKMAAFESTRYAIDGVHVRRTTDGKCAAVTTDGRRLILVTWDDEHLRSKFPVDLGSTDPVKDFAVTVSRKQWEEAGKATPRHGKQILRHCLLDETAAEGQIQMGSTDLDIWRQSSGATMEGKFPRYEDVLPKYTIGDDAVEFYVNPSLMQGVWDVMAELLGPKREQRGVRLVIPLKLGKPVLIEGETPNGLQATAVLMAVLPE